ncbi:sulfite exporter TauE/SafE family protein [Turicibacter bilis]|uniref:sulfite exporter TauE/SafE family protein n=1 Tax=Turicibacter bilis TaxID=2735723 RepID=UPI001BB0AE54|nr:sulfite exporter TauE/SafE family protein [Turicibacter bilis]MBS3202592.1 sulfite exporter TauE/SafE family protein [Turicibacter bilis]MDD5986161.1 sulfite exporter TauE/SafE family protein [Turicibacter sp.]UUF11955.1 sulfite exporter TauE/SafE family protein [Turicibacter bilis]
MLVKLLVCLIAGLGAGIGTGLAGLSAAAVISPMLISFLGVPAYQAVGISLVSDVLASAISAYTYGKNKKLDLKDGLVMMGTVLIFTLVGSYLSSLVPNQMMGSFSIYVTFLVGVKFIIRPVMTTPEVLEEKATRTKIIQSILCGIVIGLICGFVGAGGGMMLLLILTSVLGYELKTAVGTSVFIMTFTALTGGVSHLVIGGMPNLKILFLCMIFTLIGARVSAKFANKASAKVLNRTLGVVLTVIGGLMIIMDLLK